MTLRSIDVPEKVGRLKLPAFAGSFLDAANEEMERFLLQQQSVSENFVMCDFHLVAKGLLWIEEEHLRTGDRFCELGSGVGVVAMLAAMPRPFGSLQSTGIEIELPLVKQAERIANQHRIAAKFYCGSFVPRGQMWESQHDREVEHVVTDSDDVFAEMDQSIDDFDVFFAYPWPGELPFFESVVDQHAAVGALLLTYGGREGLRLSRKTS